MRHAKSYAREEVFKYLYSYEMGKEKDNILVEEGKDKLAKSIYTSVIEHKTVIDDNINKYLKKWTLEQLNPVNKSILELGIWEILYDETNKRIIISECLNLANKYSDVKSKNFIHYVLDKVETNG